MSVNLVLSDGRRYFWQWDTGQYLTAAGLPVGAEVHFDMPDCNIPLKTLVEERNGELVCRVPDERLQISGSFTVWAYVLDSVVGNRTVYSKSFNVSAREKPPTYVYTAFESMNYETLNRRLIEAEEKLAELSERGTGEGTVKSVNDITPDENGNVDLGELVTDDTVEEKILNMLEATGTVTLARADDGAVYTDENGVIYTN